MKNTINKTMMELESRINIMRQQKIHNQIVSNYKLSHRYSKEVIDNKTITVYEIH